MTWGDRPKQALPSGLDLFDKVQKPEVQPVDDLSRFVMARIIAAESEPRSEVPQAYNEAAGPMAHRYAAGVRRDMVAFRHIVRQYVELAESKWPGDASRFHGIAPAVRAIAMRWSDHPDFREEWRL